MVTLRLSLFFISLLYLSTLCTYGINCRSNHSDITIYNSEEINAFIFNSFINQKPVIINSDITHWYSNTQFFNIKNLYTNYGQNSFFCGTSIELGAINRKEPAEITLSLYLRKNKYKHYQIFDPYFIASNVDKIGLKSFDLFHKMDNQILNAYTFLLGKIGSGISFHAHGSIWLHQITGKTKVFLYPPSYSPIGGALDWNSYSSKQWSEYILPYLTEEIVDIKTPQQKEIWDSHLDRVYELNITSVSDIFNPEKQPFFNRYRPFECVLSEGQLLYIPKLWWYSTLNVKNEHNLSISMMMQTDDIPKEAALARRGYHDALRVFNTGFDYLYRHSNAISAKKYFTEVLLLDPTFISSYIALSDIFIHLAQTQEEHVETVQRFLSTAYLLNPEYEIVRESLMGLLEQKNETELLDKVRRKQPL